VGYTTFVCFSLPPFFSCVYSISVSGDINETQVSVFTWDNMTTGTVPVDGSVLFVIDQLNYPESECAKTISVDLSSIPTLKFPTGNVLAFLRCSPHISIQTRQVWATGNGNLTLGELPAKSRKYRFLSSKLSPISHLNWIAD
jgi:hypothetical protein